MSLLRNKKLSIFPSFLFLLLCYFDDFRLEGKNLAFFLFCLQRTTGRLGIFYDLQIADQLIQFVNSVRVRCNLFMSLILA